MRNQRHVVHRYSPCGCDDMTAPHCRYCLQARSSSIHGMSEDDLDSELTKSLRNASNVSLRNPFSDSPQGSGYDDVA